MMKRLVGVLGLGLLAGCALSPEEIAVASNGKLCHRYFTPIEMDYRSPLIQQELARRGERLGYSPCENAPYNPLTGQSVAGPAFVPVVPAQPLVVQQQRVPAAIVNCQTTRMGVVANTSCTGL